MMKRLNILNIALVTLTLILILSSCKSPVRELIYDNPDLKIIFLHHSTGRHVWFGDISPDKKVLKETMCMTPRLLKEYNEETGKKISIKEQAFPSGDPYPWHNYPYDYYNIWVKNAGEELFKGEPTLEVLTKEYDIIVFKHCFPVSKILEDDTIPDINSAKKTLANYKLQYNALKTKLHEFPNTKFIVWTGAALVESKTNEEQAARAIAFSEWVKAEWDEPQDNIEIFDFRQIETDGGFYLKPEYAVDPKWNSHPNTNLSEKASKLFVEKLIQTIEQ